jgi:hypothetical protein
MPGLGFAIAGHADHMVRQQGRVAVRPHPHTRKIAKETVFDLPVAHLEVKVFSHVQHAVLAHGSLNVKQSDSFLPGDKTSECAGLNGTLNSHSRRKKRQINVHFTTIPSLE